MNVPNREAVELNSRGQRPRLARQRRPTLKGSNSILFDPSKVGLMVGQDPVALPPATRLVRYANHRPAYCAKRGVSQIILWQRQRSRQQWKWRALIKPTASAHRPQTHPRRIDTAPLVDSKMTRRLPTGIPFTELSDGSFFSFFGFFFFPFFLCFSFPYLSSTFRCL